MSPRGRTRAIGLGSFLLVAIACGDSGTEPPRPTAAQPVSGDGIASTRWTLGAEAGEQSAIAEVDGLTPVTFVVDVLPGPAASVIVTPDSVAMVFADTVHLGVSVADEYGNPITGRSIDWSSSDPRVAAADSAGVVRGTGPGTATIMAGVGQARGEAVVVVAPLSFATVHPGGVHTCALTPAGLAYCWGDGRTGRVGRSTDEAAVSTPIPVAGGARFTRLSAGRDHTCAITTAGAAYCWGQNGVGQLGDGTTEDHAEPTPVAGGRSFRAVSTGVSHMCALAPGGTGLCWGDDGDGTFGDGEAGAGAAEPVAAFSGATFARLSASGRHVCAIADGGAASCWGSNTHGQVGDGTTTARAQPVAVAGGLEFARIDAGYSHTCGVTTAGDAYCWGAGRNGRIGDGSTSDRPRPRAVAGTTSWVAARAGGDHSCGRSDEGVAYCWGWNKQGQLGDGSLSERSSPVRVAGQEP